ncbi:cell division protein PerM [Arthrobacter sp. zg-Y40]|uniref:cell division protein PerM n=1 Tax=Arthrobacter sp. zg-Y40 TaxID=2886939 RepID=UPI003FA41F04
MKILLRPKKPGVPPMPLWLQGTFELGQAAVLSALLVLLPLVGVWLANGFTDIDFTSLARLGGQAWLLIHGVPLQLSFPAGELGTGPASGLLSFFPLGLTLIPFFLSWRAGRRLARASYTDQLWQALLGALGAYALLGAAAAYFSSTDGVRISVAAGALLPLIAAGAGLIVGARIEAGSWVRLIGMDLTAWIARTSQHSRWAGSYMWAALRAGVVGIVAALGLSSLLLVVTLAMSWAEMVSVYERLGAGVLGGTVLTVVELGLMPNFVVWTLGWASGAGFSLGTGSIISPLETTVGPLPALPVLAALPTGSMEYGYAALLIPVVAGILAGWWFLREGENHFDEWLSIKIRARWFTAPVSTLVLGAIVGLVSGLLAAGAAWLSVGSLGIGRFVQLGPDPLWLGLWVAAEVGAGVVIGYAVGPWLEREPKPEKQRAAV